ncbi:MAG: glutamate synthase [Deltaproteobacteria bacterium]|nr:glutamate synthase [Deltaproteobacteria bacterium]
MNSHEYVRSILAARQDLYKGMPKNLSLSTEEEGGCGVTGFCCSIPVRGRHIFKPSAQMHNRGNGKGGGIAAMGFIPEMLGVDQTTLNEDYLIHIADLDGEGLKALEDKFIYPFLDVHLAENIPHVDDYRDIAGLEVRPPDIYRYFARVKPNVLKAFAAKKGLTKMAPRDLEDEFIYQNSVSINRTFYDPQGKMKAFVMSHGRNFFVLKIVGYAEWVVQYYKLDNFKANIWIAHQRYPTKGRVWHPGGAHPFIGLNEALVHNGDFANYYSVAEYLKQRNIFPLFHTDTEVSALLFDLYSRVYGYSLEHLIEALAPTQEMDFDYLSKDRQRIYQEIQKTHIHASPDGPWFFIVARNDTKNNELQLLGITDTAMLRPQVFALQEGSIKIGLVCSEKQAIDATLDSLAAEDPRFGTVADMYWNARGGSHTDGGTFIFRLDNSKSNGEEKPMTCTDKFGREIKAPQNQVPFLPGRVFYLMDDGQKPMLDLTEEYAKGDADALYKMFIASIRDWDYAETLDCLKELKRQANESDGNLDLTLSVMTRLIDLRYPTFEKKRRSLLQMYNYTLNRILCGVAPLNSDQAQGKYRYIDFESRKTLRAPLPGEAVLVVDSALFPPEGDEADGVLLREAYRLGWKQFIIFRCRGQRFYGCGFGPATQGVRMDIYGSSGDYIASGADGLEIYIHGNAQDQLGQIMKEGKLVIYGDVGQTFMYGAKGGDVYIMGNAAGRPLINAVGHPRVVINGTCLDFLAESFMAGDPLNGGGFVVVNGMTIDHQGNVIPQASPYPGSNLFSLASGGAIYVRDPHKLLVEEQLNGGVYADMTEADWELILPYLQENERLFNISVENHLLKVDGQPRTYDEVYRKVAAQKLAVLTGKAQKDGLEEYK